MHSRTRTELTKARAAKPRLAHGFGLVELIVVLAVISVVMTFAVLGIRSAMASIRLQNSMRQLASRVEMARIDAIRRHKLATVEFTSQTSYAITMDFDGKGVVKKRSYNLESGVTLANSEWPMFEFDSRGRTTQCFTSIKLESQGGGGSSTLSVTSAGDVTMDAGLAANMNSGTFTAVSTTDDVQKGAVVTGASQVCTDTCGGCVPATEEEGKSTPPPGCVEFKVKPTFISIRKNYKSSLGIVVTTTVADTITVIQNDGRTNLAFTPSPTQAITGTTGGSKTFTVTSKSNLTGTFQLKFISACNPTNVAYATVQVNP